MRFGKEFRHLVMAHSPMSADKHFIAERSWEVAVDCVMKDLEEFRKSCEGKSWIDITDFIESRKERK